MPSKVTRATPARKPIARSRKAADVASPKRSKPAPSNSKSRKPAPAAVAAPLPPAASGSAAIASTSKQSRLITLLRSKEGGTIDQMTSLTGWQRHTVRGTISGVLRKRLQLNVVCSEPVDDGARVYRIVEGVPR